MWRPLLIYLHNTVNLVNKPETGEKSNCPRKEKENQDHDERVAEV